MPARAQPEAADDTTIVGGIRIGPGMMLSLPKINYYFDHDWLGDPDERLILEITHVGDISSCRGPNDEFASDWVFIVGHEFISATNIRCHAVNVRISGLEEALTYHERVTDLAIRND